MSVYVEYMNGKYKAFQVPYTENMSISNLSSTIAESIKTHEETFTRNLSIYSKNRNNSYKHIKDGKIVSHPNSNGIGSSEENPYYFTITSKTKAAPTGISVEHVRKKQKTAPKQKLTVAIQKLALLDQNIAKRMVLTTVLKVTDLKMKFIISEDIVLNITNQLIPQYVNAAKGKPACLIYGHPGSGKTRLFYELLDTMTGNTRGDLYTKLSVASDLITISKISAVAVTFNTPHYCCTSEDAQLCNVRLDLPVSLRLFYIYFKHDYPMDCEGFQQMRHDLLQICMDDSFLRHFTVKALLKAILVSNKDKNHLLLLIDETLSLRKQIVEQNTKDDSRFNQFLSFMNALQDAGSGNLDEVTKKTCFSIIYSGLLDGPWVKDASASGRQLNKYLLTPLPPTIDTFNMIAETGGIKELSKYYSLIQQDQPLPVSTCTALAEYFFYCSAGLPRAVEVLRSYFEEQRSNNELRFLLNSCAQLLRVQYQAQSNQVTFHLALLGRAIDGNKEENVEYVAMLHTYMSEGKCMLLTVTSQYGIIEEGCVTVSIPPMRLFSCVGDHQRLLVITSEMNNKTFEKFLFQLEVSVRAARRTIVNEKLNGLFVSPYCHVDFCNATLQELYFGTANDNDILVKWRDESVRNARFDFTAPLQIKYMKGNNAIPHFSNASKFENFIIIPENRNQKGFEYAIILRTNDSESKMIALLVQAKFTTMQTIQEVPEINDTLVKCEAAINGVGNNLGWPSNNIVVLFQTNRNKRIYKKLENSHNLILMCKQSLKQFMGPMVWSMLYSCHCLANLQVGVSESVQSAQETKE